MSQLPYRTYKDIGGWFVSEFAARPGKMSLEQVLTARVTGLITRNEECVRQHHLVHQP